MKQAIFILLICFHVVGFTQDYNAEGRLLWEISTPVGRSYLFGTLHSNDKRLFNFPDSVYDAFSRSESLAIEVNIFDLFLDKDPIPNRGNILLDKYGKLYTASQEPTATYYGDEDGMPQFMDAWFQEKAERLNKSVIPLESIAQQTKAMEEIPFIEKGNKLNLLISEKQLMLELYLNGRIDLIDRLIKSGLSNNKEAYLKLIEQRNLQMADKISNMAMKKNVFFAVGAGHLHGEKGLVTLLREKGYKVRCVALDYSEKPGNAAQQIKALQPVEVNQQMGESTLKAVFPGKPRTKIQDDLEEIGLVYKELGQGNTFEVSWIKRDSSLSLLQYAEILIASPPQSPYFYGELDDGTEFTQGLSEVYSQGLTWVRLIINKEFVVKITCSGGNKFMNSDRPNRFFNNVILE
jgi:uncharacterized protein YbaP (TraB family)